jgi:hypothetical protein
MATETVQKTGNYHANAYGQTRYRAAWIPSIVSIWRQAPMVGCFQFRFAAAVRARRPHLRLRTMAMPKGLPPRRDLSINLPNGSDQRRLPARRRPSKCAPVLVKVRNGLTIPNLVSTNLCNIDQGERSQTRPS